MPIPFKLSAAVALALHMSASCAAPDDALGLQADQLFQKWQGPATPGCAVSVTQAGKPLLERAWGQADLEHGAPNTVGTVFEAGSIAKQFTAAAILLLVQDGKLALTDDVRKVLPELPDYGRPITIDHLLQQTSGLRDWGAIVELGGWPRGTRVVTMEQALALTVRQRALNFATGARYSYSNTDYVLAALVVQRVSGKTLAQFTRERLFVPLGMAHTGWRDNFRRVVPGRAVAYARTEDGYEQDMPFEDVYGHGGLLTTVGDLQIWNQALSTNRLGIAEQLQQTPSLPPGQASEYGRGLTVSSQRGALELWHDGATGGYRTWLGRYPQHGLSIALLCNAGDVSPGRLGRALAHTLLPAEAAPTPGDEPAARAAFAGSFYNELNASRLTLEHRDGRLALANGPALRALDARSFALMGGTLTFADDNSFVAQAPGFEPMRFRRVRAAPTATALQASLQIYAGRYRNDEVMATYDVIPREAGLDLRMADKPGHVYRLEQFGADTFGGGDIVVRFQRDARGRIAGARVAAERLYEVRFRKVARQVSQNL